MIKIVTIVGARPQFIKAAAITRLIREGFKDQIIEIMIHTGQHFDKNMSSIFFEELEIPEPEYNLEISGGQHGAMTGRMLEAIENVLIVEKPDWVLIYGDTNSTLAGAIAASKLHIPVAHVEAGLRSFNMRMPEEINRIIADRISNILLCPTETSVENLKKEALSASAHLVGDVMYDVSLFYQKKALERSTILHKMGLSDGKYVLTTCHRAENTDDYKRFKSIVDALAKIAESIPVVFPIHPRTRKFLEKYQLQDVLKKVILVDPLPFLDMVRLEQSAKVILTDSGGVQKEAFFYGVPCVTMRDETEWIETVDAGWNTLTGADTEAIIQAFLASDKPPQRSGITPYGEGNASELCLKAILQAHTTC
jgi:UDP-GlcNAc3NAcA epimerase